MPPSSTRVSVVEDVVIPAHLLASTTPSNHLWNSSHCDRSKQGPIQQAIQTAAFERECGRLRRSATISGHQPPKIRTIANTRRLSEPLSVSELSSITEIQSPCFSPRLDFDARAEGARSPAHLVQVNEQIADEGVQFPHDIQPRDGLGASNSVPGTRDGAWPLPPRPQSYRISRIETGTRPRTARQAARHSIYDIYQKAKERRAALQRKYWAQVLFEYAVYFLLIAFIYFVLVGIPLWKGAVWWLYYVVRFEFVIQGGWAITIGVAFLYVSWLSQWWNCGKSLTLSLSG